MAAETAAEAVRIGISSLSLENAVIAFFPVSIFVAGLLIYFTFLFAMYEFISRRDPFKLVYAPTERLEKVGSILEYVFFFPIITFSWFLILACLLATITNAASISGVLALTASITITMRVASYINERLSRSIAKLIPLSFVSALLINFSNLSFNTPFRTLSQVPYYTEILIYYFVFIMIFEVLLKVIGHYMLESDKENKPEMPRERFSF